MTTEHVEFDWSTEWGSCYECGLPAAFRLVGLAVYETNLDSWKRCAVCAANAAATGEFIARIDATPEPDEPDDQDIAEGHLRSHDYEGWANL